MPIALLALTAGAFGIGTTEFVIMGLLLQVSKDLPVSIATAGLHITGYALGVAAVRPVNMRAIAEARLSGGTSPVATTAPTPKKVPCASEVSTRAAISAP